MPIPSPPSRLNMPTCPCVPSQAGHKQHRWGTNLWSVWSAGRTGPKSGPVPPVPLLAAQCWLIARLMSLCPCECVATCHATQCHLFSSGILVEPCDRMTSCNRLISHLEWVQEMRLFNQEMTISVRFAQRLRQCLGGNEGAVVTHQRAQHCYHLNLFTAS